MVPAWNIFSGTYIGMDSKFTAKVFYHDAIS
jgi:hypothetical protein